MAVDDEVEGYYPYKQTRSVPFKWEIRPGVPKDNSSPAASSRQQKLKPPPSSSSIVPFCCHPSPSYLSSPRTHSLRLLSAEPQLVGCFPSPSRRSSSRRGRSRVGSESESGPDCGSDLETLPRRSVSWRKSTSPFHHSPRPSVSQAEWDACSLF
uniref:Uncharacterized protein n=1 Tax=Kalanchoe fedtschenkoi TaxID=63787 RepID=A0A7N0RDG5_KALFE